jgi:hypothetical protein
MFLFLLGGEAHGDIQSGISNENRGRGKQFFPPTGFDFQELP